jgi:hypothetical protein
MRPYKHPFTIDSAPGEFEDVRPDPGKPGRDSDLIERAQAIPTADKLVYVLVGVCFTGTAGIVAYLFARFKGWL